MQCIKYDADKIRLERGRCGLSRSELAKLADIHFKTIERIEQNKVIPHIQTLGRIAKALNRELEYFLQQ
jgi:transcriptional regulator with XRE-family HTH domain